jgi:hypothetical protein
LGACCYLSKGSVDAWTYGEVHTVNPHVQLPAARLADPVLGVERLDIVQKVPSFRTRVHEDFVGFRLDIEVLKSGRQPNLQALIRFYNIACHDDLQLPLYSLEEYRNDLGDAIS